MHIRVNATGRVASRVGVRVRVIILDESHDRGAIVKCVKRRIGCVIRSQVI